MSGVETALAISALAAGAGAYQQNQVANKQDQAAAHGIRMQSQQQQRANDAVNQLINQTAASNPEAQADAARQQFMHQLMANRNATAGSFTPVAAASDRYTADAASALGDSNKYAANLAGTLSQIDAPARQRQLEAQAYGRTGTALSQIGADAAGQDFLTRLRARNIRANPWLSAAIDVGKGYSSTVTPTSAGAGSGSGSSLSALDAAQPSQYLGLGVA